MGFNTVAVLYNDYTGEFKTQGDRIGPRIAQAIQRYDHNDRNHRNFGAGVVISQAHADGEQVTIVHANTGWTADEATPGTYTELSWRGLDQMQRCLERHGYKVTKPKKVAKPEAVHPRSVHAAHHEWKLRHGQDFPLNAATVVGIIADAQRAGLTGVKRRKAIQEGMKAAASEIHAPTVRQDAPAE